MGKIKYYFYKFFKTKLSKFHRIKWFYTHYWENGMEWEGFYDCLVDVDVTYIQWYLPNENEPDKPHIIDVITPKYIYQVWDKKLNRINLLKFEPKYIIKK